MPGNSPDIELFGDGKIAPSSTLDIGNAFTKNKDFDPTINTDPTSNKHTKVPVSAPLPSTYDRSPSDLTQTAISIGLSIGVWNICGWSIDPDQMLHSNVIKACNLDISGGFRNSERGGGGGDRKFWGCHAHFRSRWQSGLNISKQL